MSTPIDDLCERLQLDPLDRDLFLGDPGEGQGRLFGGLVAAQSVMAAIATLGKDLSCCLCLSTFERPVRTSCKHYYCAECLNESLRRKQQCPLCKEKVTRRDVQDDEFVAALVWKYRRIVTAANA